MIVHAGLIALRGRDRDGGQWRGALIQGPSGVGKSDLALRCIDQGPWRLVADDRARLFVSGGGLFGRAPAALAGKLEARGLGILEFPPLAFARVCLVVDCLAPGETAERLPADEGANLLGVGVPRLALTAAHASAPALLTAALRRLGGHAQPE